MGQEPILITTQYEAEKFDSFIALPDNHRILLKLISKSITSTASPTTKS